MSFDEKSTQNKEMKANLLLNGKLVTIDISYVIIGEYSFLNEKDYIASTIPTFHYSEIELPITGENLFLIECKKDNSYRFCSSANPVNELALLQRGSRHKLEILACCEDDPVFEAYYMKNII